VNRYRIARRSACAGGEPWGRRQNTRQDRDRQGREQFRHPLPRGAAASDRAARLPGLELVGVHMHIGSQIIIR